MMRATKPFRYEHRMLAAGDTFEIDARFAKVLRITRRAVEVRAPAVVPPPPPAVAEKIAEAVARPSSDLTPYAIALARRDYEREVGAKPDMRWSIATLREKIAAAKADQ